MNIMNDREKFRKNLNYLLLTSGKLQKELAEYVGAKTTTVSGWTRGISYPRADSMELIAKFFGVPTPLLVGDPGHSETADILKDEEKNLIIAYRAADDRARADALVILLQHPAAK